MKNTILTNKHSYGLTPTDTKMLQGLSILAMVMLHLFDRINYEGLYMPLLYFMGRPVIFYIAQLSDFCVMGYAFCSGYALYTQFSEYTDVKAYYQGRRKGLRLLLINYWLILVSFTIVSILMKNGDQIPGSLLEFIGNFTTVNTTYNGAWWYLFIYILLVLLSASIFKCCKKIPSWITLGATFFIYASAYYVRFHVNNNWLLGKYGVFGMTLFECVIGAVCAKDKWIEKARTISEKVPGWIRITVSCILMVGMLIGHTWIVPSLFVAPFTGLIIIFIFSLWRKPQWVQSIFLCLGRHSTNIWLIHMFFYMIYFKKLVFIPKYPVFIFIWLVILCLISSYLTLPILACRLKR